jgi:hypothetical protein
MTTANSAGNFSDDWGNENGVDWASNSYLNTEYGQESNGGPGGGFNQPTFNFEVHFFGPHHRGMFPVGVLNESNNEKGVLID